MKINYPFFSGNEFIYLYIGPKIIAEKYIENFDGDIYDYKVFCYNGKVDSIMFLNERKKIEKCHFMI